MSKPLVFNFLALVTLLIAFHITHLKVQEEKRPIIGILTSPSDFQHLYDPSEFSYIKNSYGDFLEAAGAIPVAIPWDLPEKDLISLLNSINGVLFTGGDASLWEFDEESQTEVFTNFTKRSAFIFNHVLELNNRGIHYPLYGICQGHETILMSLRGSHDIIDHYKHPGQLDTVNIIKRERMWANMPDHLMEHLRNEHSLFYNHRFGFNLSLFEEVPSLAEFFTVTAVDIDDNGKEFIAAMEAKDYPIFTVQYHPEKIISEWMNNNTHFKHKDEAAQAILLHSQFFVNEAKKNMHLHQFADEVILNKFKLSSHEHQYFNVTWPKVFFYDKKSPIVYHVNPDWEDNLPLDDIVDDNEAPEVEL